MELIAEVKAAEGTYILQHPAAQSCSALYSHLFRLLAASQCTALLPPLCWTIELCSVPPPPTVPLGAFGTRETGREERKCLSNCRIGCQEFLLNEHERTEKESVMQKVLFSILYLILLQPCPTFILGMETFQRHRQSTHLWHGLFVPCFFLCPWTYDESGRTSTEHH